VALDVERAGLTVWAHTSVVFVNVMRVLLIRKPVLGPSGGIRGGRHPIRLCPHTPPPTPPTPTTPTPTFSSWPTLNPAVQTLSQALALQQPFPSFASLATRQRRFLKVSSSVGSAVSSTWLRCSTISSPRRHGDLSKSLSTTPRSAPSPRVLFTKHQKRSPRTPTWAPNSPCADGGGEERGPK